MSAPRRWIEEGGGASPFERDLLRSARSVDPPPGAQSQVLAALLTKLPPPGGAGPSSGAAAAKSAAAAKGAALAAVGGILKGALIGAGSAVALIATYTLVTPGLDGGARLQAPAPRSEASGNSPAAIAAPAPTVRSPYPRSAGALPPDSPRVAAGPTADQPGERPRAFPDDRHLAPAPAAPTLAEAPAAAVSAPSPAVESATERETMLREENQQMSDARAAMRRGDAPRALVLLEQVRARFPGGMLVQEREALAIEALARSGRRGDASARAAAFLRAYPTSMFAERVQAFAR